MLERELDLCLRARCTLLVVVTPEEGRALDAVKAHCGTQRPALTWDLADGFRALAGPAPSFAARDPLTALDNIDRADGDALFVLPDFHDCWANAQVKRKLKAVAQRLRATRKAIVAIVPDLAGFPKELRDEAVVLDLPPPGSPELEAVLDRLTKAGGPRVALTPLGRDKLVRAALGLSVAQAGRAFARALVAGGGLDERAIDLVTEEKRQLLRESAALEYQPLTETDTGVGGLGALKAWLRLRERAFTREAAEYGLPAPRGVALLGIPGTGKSLCARLVSGTWRLPLLRLDVGALYGGLVGQSEEQTRRALRLAEAVAPCLLWIDELEKAVAAGGGDGGTSARVLGTLLTWLQEKTAPVFVVATANDVGELPPELLRRGRFDEVFFLDLPTAEERHEIAAVHLRKRRRLPADFEVDALARASEGRVGAEIEQAVVEAMYAGFAEEREFTTADVLTALARQVPLAVAQREAVGAMRACLREGRALSASFAEAREAERRFVPLQVDNP
jgi:AAA+ superfamily predicted ATPase